MTNDYLEDLLVNLKNIEGNFSKFYKNISNMESYTSKIRSVAKVLAREEQRHVLFYDEMLKEFKGDIYITLEKDVYIKSKQFLIDFKDELCLNDMNSNSNLIEMAIKYEKLNVEIIKDIIEMLEQNYEQNKRTIDLFSVLLNEEIKHSNNLKAFL
jgi:ferritin-like protein